MNTDIRLSTSFKGHPKREKIKRLLREDATGYLIDLWLTVAQNRPKGDLSGWDEDDIAIAANWSGESSDFVNALIKCKWLEVDENGTYHCHQWAENQPYATFAPERSNQARKAADARWDKRLNNKEDKNKEDLGECPQQCSEHTDSNARSNAPSPSPSPSPVPDPNPIPSPDPDPAPTPEKSSACKSAASAAAHTDCPDIDFSSQSKEEYKSKNGEILTGDMLTSFNIFWEAYDHKKGKPEAADAWIAIEGIDKIEVIEAAMWAARAREEEKARGQTPMKPANWLINRRYEDEFAESSPYSKDVSY